MPKTVFARLKLALLCTLTSGLLCLPGTAAAQAAQASRAAQACTLSEAALIGSGSFTWFGLRLYDARLWADKNNFSATNWSAGTLALELVYARRLYGERIAVASIDEIRKLGAGTAAQQEAWLAAMKKLFPDVEDGTQLTGCFVPGQATRFFRDGVLIGEVADPDFGPAFFGIWLHPKSSAPKLRAALLGGR